MGGCKHIFYLCVSFIGPWVRAEKLSKYLLMDCKDNSSVPFTLLLSLSGRKEKVIAAALASSPSPGHAPPLGAAAGPAPDLMLYSVAPLP